MTPGIKPPLEQFTVVLVALPGYRQPAAARLKHFLKMALRACGFRAVTVGTSDSVGEPENNPSSGDK